MDDNKTLLFQKFRQKEKPIENENKKTDLKKNKKPWHDFSFSLVINAMVQRCSVIIVIQLDFEK